MNRFTSLAVLVWALLLPLRAQSVRGAEPKERSPEMKAAIEKGLDALAKMQNRQGYWDANQGQYRVAMTALSGTALLAEGSTTTRGKYSENINRAVDYLVSVAKPNGLIGYENDYRYTYGHGFSLLFLSQVFGEEEDVTRREMLQKVLTKGVEFCARAQTSRGGWGYVSAKDGNDFDEGSTCVTQVQGLRACRNAGIAVPKEVINRATKYIEDCTTDEGGVQYSFARKGSPRPPITAAALATLYNAGENEGDHLKRMREYCDKNVWPGGANINTMYGHWHYAHYYFAQAKYRAGDEEWGKYISAIGRDIIRQQAADGSWREGHIGHAYTTAINLTILQLDNGYLPIYQR